MFLGGVYYSNISGISGFIAIPSNHESLLCSNHASPLRVTMWCSSDTYSISHISSGCVHGPGAQPAGGHGIWNLDDFE